MRPFGNITPIQYVAAAAALFLLYVLAASIIATMLERRSERLYDALDDARDRHPSNDWGDQ